MQVVIDGKRVSLNQKDVLGAGGEGTVFRSIVNGNDVAVKIYHQMDPYRTRKVQAFLTKHWLLPLQKIAAPLQLVYDSKGNKVVGLTMPFLGKGFEELANLSNKRFRASFIINTMTVAQIFLDGAKTVQQIHKNGLVVGDFNDLNELFRGTEMLFIDVDSWQFDNYSCPVATEQFLAPELYGIDLSLRPVFKPEHDWYAFAALLFKSLLYVHPYGGTHRDYKHITARARQKITVFHPDVTYPKIGLSPDLLDDNLTAAFERIFARGQRGEFPVDILEAYARSLVECKGCGTQYPHSRKQCPICTGQMLIIIQRPAQPTTVTRGVTVVEFIRTAGNIVFHKIVGNNIYVLAYENGKAVLYEKRGNGPLNRRELFNEIAGARYELLGEVLIVNLPGQTELLLIDLAGGQVQPLLKSETAIFSVTRRAMFRTSQQYLFRIVGGNLMYGYFKNGQLIERPLRPVMNDLTWFAVHEQPSSDKPTACGFFQIMNQQMFWLVWGGSTYDNLPISELDIDEALVDVSVKFSSQGVLIRRLTLSQGVNYIRTDMVNSDGRVLFSSPKVREEDYVGESIIGQAYTTGKLLHPTDDGVVQEDIISGATKTFDATKGHVEGGNILYPYQGGLLVIKDTVIEHIVLTG
jgi:hypothetical protein